MPDESLCDCPLEGDTPADVERCMAENDGDYCSRPDGHDGPHAACSIKQHPVKTWDQD